MVRAAGATLRAEPFGSAMRERAAARMRRPGLFSAKPEGDEKNNVPGRFSFRHSRSNVIENVPGCLRATK